MIAYNPNMTCKEDLAHFIVSTSNLRGPKSNIDNVAIDPILIATIISIIVQIIKLIYDYKNPKLLLDDIKNPGIMRRIYLVFKVNQILSANKCEIGTFKFLELVRTALANKNVMDIQALMNSCK
jgi:hypothetical protein